MVGGNEKRNNSGDTDDRTHSEREIRMERRRTERNARREKSSMENMGTRRKQERGRGTDVKQKGRGPTNHIGQATVT